MNKKHPLIAAAVTAVLTSALGLAPSAATGAELTPEEELGQEIFFDRNLSLLRNQACATCHVPEAGWVGADTKINEAGGVYEGSIPGEFGNRNPPSSAYATPSPIFYLDEEEGLFVGGNFWDGRATGWELGDPAAEQARGPFLNPVEQALPDKACVVYRVCEGQYGTLFDAVWPGACMIDWPGNGVVNQQCVKSDGMVPLSDEERTRVDDAYDKIARSISAFEDSPASNAYSSKLDAVRALNAESPGSGDALLTEQEKLGREVFRSKGMCSECHVGSPLLAPPPLLTDFTFDNLGVPRNPQNPASIADPAWRDPGLGGFLGTLVDDPEPEVKALAEYADENLGKHKVPTLRNVGLGSCEAQEFAGAPPKNCITKAYMHNGYFNSLWQVVHFYNTRDFKDSCESLEIEDATVDIALENDCWPAPEVVENVNVDELGDLGLTEEEELALVAFMMTMSDGYSAEAP
jgi:cytochrome c peroxidase